MFAEIFYNFYGYNQTIFLFFNKVTNISILADILQIISFCFNIENFALIYILYCIYTYIQLKKTQNLSDITDYFWASYNKIAEIGITYLVFGLIFAALKFSINLPRPFCSISQEDFITIINITTERCLSSFPSSHTGIALLVSYFLWPHLKALGKIFMIILVVLVSISRMTLAMHYPADLIYGIIMTILAIIIGKTIYKLLANNLIKFIGAHIFNYIKCK